MVLFIAPITRQIQVQCLNYLHSEPFYAFSECFISIRESNPFIYPLSFHRDKSTTNKLKSEVNNSSEPQFLLDSTPISTDNDTKSQSNSKKCKRQNDIDGQQVWSACCLLSVTYRTISAGYKDWARHFNDILDVLECGEVFYNPVVRGRCLETLCEMIEYSRCMHDYSSFHQSIQLSSKIVRFLQSIMVQIVLTKDKALNPGGRLLQTVLMIQYRILAQGKSLRSNDTTLTAKTCYHCLASNDSKTRSVAIGMFYSVEFR